MTSLYYNSAGVDWDDLFEQETNGNGVGDPAYKRADGSIIRYARRALGSAVADVGYARTDGAGDVATLWAAKGSVALLNNFGSGSYVSTCESVTYSDLLYADLKITLNSNGTGSISRQSTNSTADNVSAYDTYGVDNYPAGQTLATFNWAKNPVAGFGSNYTVDCTVSSSAIGWRNYYAYNTASNVATNPPLNHSSAYYDTFFNGGASGTGGYPRGCGPAYCSAIGFVHNPNKDNFPGQTKTVTGLDLTNGVVVGPQFQGLGASSLGSYIDSQGGLSWYYQLTVTLTIRSKTTAEQYTQSFTFFIELRWQATSYSGGGGSGGGGGGGCVAMDSFFPDGSTAAQLRPGDYLLVTNPYLTGSETCTSDGELVMAPCDQYTGNTVDGKVLYASPETQPGLRLTTESGATLDCSTTAVIPTLEKGYQFSPDLKDLHVPVAARGDIVDGRTAFTWEKVVSVESIGPLRVQKIFVQNRCFWASKDGQRFILHHNLKPAAGAA